MPVEERMAKVVYLVSMVHYYKIFIPGMDMRPQLHEALEELKGIVEYLEREEAKAKNVSVSEQQKSQD